MKTIEPLIKQETKTTTIARGVSCGFNVEPEVTFCECQQKKESMKKILTLMTGALMLGVAFSASAIIVTFDETGIGSYQPAGPAIPFTGVLAADPLNGGVLALTYTLPAAAGTVTLGDILVYEPGSTTVVSDLLRFEANRKIVVYSAAGGSDLADNGNWPTGLQANQLKVNESDLGGGLAEAFFAVSTGQPGFFDGSVIYDFTSDEVPPPVPEPTTIISGVLMLLPFGASTLRILRKRQVA